MTDPSLPDLPITELLEPIGRALGQSSAVVIEAPPGAGKTTAVPLALLNAPWLRERRIVMLQPRRIATRNAAARLAELLGETAGQTVGYRMRLDTRVGPATRIEVVTEGVLRRMLTRDPTLEGVGLVIFDEFHERSLDADLSLALALHARATFEEEADFRIAVMSATLAGLPLGELLDAPVLRSDGRQYPVEVRWGQPFRPRERIIDRVPGVIDEALQRHPGSSVLVFLPGQGEIRRVAGSLHVPADTDVRPLYGDLSLSEQQRAIAPSPKGRRKVVLATNVAETSLTIDGVDVVIDAGLERVPAFDPGTAMTRLTTTRISQASAEQRRGRAGRLRPGICYRLWSEAQHGQLAAQAGAEIAKADLADLALELLAWGITDPAELHWLTPPPTGAWQQALELLRALGALAGDRRRPTLTRHGQLMATLPTHPRLAHMLLTGIASGAADTACQLAAVLSDRDPVSRESPDMERRLEYLQEQRTAPPTLRGWVQRATQLADRLRRQLPEVPAALARPDPEQRPGFLLACAYPDRVARRRHSGGFQLANGRSAIFAERHPLDQKKWLVVAEASGVQGRSQDTIRSAATLDERLFDSALASLAQEETRIEWDAKSGRFLATRERRIGALRLSSTRLETVSAEERLQGLVTLLRENDLARLDWNDAARTFRERAELMRSLDATWPDFSMPALGAALEEWLGPYLTGVKHLTDLRRVDVAAALRARLDWPQQQRLDAWLPERIQLPSGNTVRLDYGQQPPVLAAKLQELFGWDASPTLAEGRLPVVVHLLSPAGRPLQITQDLAGFWRTGYEAVKKEMKGRYPKHPWPDDPLAARATRRTKQRQAQSGQDR